MDFSSFGWKIVTALFISALAVNIRTWRKNRKEYWKVNKTVESTTILAITAFAFLFLTSLLVQIFKTVSFKRNLIVVQIFDILAVSFHFAVTAMTTGLLMDKTDFTKEILNSFIIDGDLHTIAYFEVCFMLGLAPVSTAGWLISALDSDIGAKLRMLSFHNHPAIVFFNSSDRSILTAGFLNEFLQQKKVDSSDKGTSTAGFLNESIQQKKNDSSDKGTSAADFLTGFLQKKNKPVIVFCRSDSKQNQASLETRAEIRKLKGIPVKYTERDYVYPQGKDNILFLCAKSLTEVTGYLPAQYSCPDNISKVFLMTNEAESEIDLVKKAVSGDDGEKSPNTSLPDVEPLSIWEANAELTYQIIKDLDNGILVGEGNILPVVLEKLEERFEKTEEAGEKKDKTHHITVFSLTETVSGRLAMEYGDLKGEQHKQNQQNSTIEINEDVYRKDISAYDLITRHIERNYPETSKWLLLLSEDETANLRRKRRFCKTYSENLNKGSLTIIVYCSNRMETAKEKNWEKNNQIQNVYYIGEDRAAIRWLYEEKIKNLL